MTYAVPQFNRSDTIAVGSSLLTGATSTTLTTGAFGSPSGPQYYVIDWNNSKAEVISATVSGTSVTDVVRGLDGTTDQDHVQGAPIISSLVPSAYSQVTNALASAQGADGWVAVPGVVSYASSTALNVQAGAMSVYSVGDKVKLDQSIPLTSYWPLNSSSTDTKGSNSGTDTSVTYTASGHGSFGNAWTGNGTSSKTVIPDSTSLHLGAGNVPFSWVGWAKSSNSVLQLLFQSYSINPNAAGFKISTNTSKKIDVIVGKNTGSTANTDYTLISGNTVVCDGAWHYIALSYQSNFLKLFVDGNLEASGSCVTPAYAATNYVRLGCDNGVGTDANFWNGQIDDMFIINGFAVDQAWVKAKYAQGTPQTNANITATQYMYVTSLTDTQLTLTGGSDYSLYNGAITNAYYSKAVSPVGFPTEFNLSTSIGSQYISINGRLGTIRGTINGTIPSGQPSVNVTVTWGRPFSSPPVVSNSQTTPSQSFSSFAEEPTLALQDKATSTQCTFRYLTRGGGNVAANRLCTGDFIAIGYI